jgi:hypothetical protein
MTQDEIIEMARQAGFEIESGMFDAKVVCVEGVSITRELEAFAKLVAAKKQEDIIQIIKETPFSNWFQADVIEAIRARGEQA